MISLLRKSLPIKLLLWLHLVILAGCALIEKDRDELRALRAHVQTLERHLQALDYEQRQITEVLARARGAVAYIRGTYTFVDSSGRPLRHVLNDAGEPIADAQGVPLVDLTGTGSVAVTDYCGTGFLVDSAGQLLTNRHIAEPWWEDEASAPLLASGLKPVFLRLRAFFQGHTEPVALEVVRVHEEHDIAMVRAIGWSPATEPLPLLSDSGRFEEGQPVILIGYPTGINAILAKLDWPEQAKLQNLTKGDGYAITEQLALMQELRPTITGGYLWEILPTTLVYDARTAAGGSGGPLLDRRGRVVGVNTAYLPSFSGGNYAVPARFAAELLSGGGLAASGPRQETPVVVVKSAGAREEDIPSGPATKPVHQQK